MTRFRFAGEDIHIPMMLVVFSVGLAGGLAGKLIGLPLPMLLGSVITVAAMSIFELRPFGEVPRIPFWMRPAFLPIIGLSIGATFTPDTMEEAKRWWPSLAALVLFIPIVHYMGYRLLLKAGGLSKTTAYYGAVPGGLIVCVQLGEEAGADVTMLTALQFLRLILTVMLVPLAFTVMSGTAVGSAAGVSFIKDIIPMTPTELVLQVVVGAVGFFGGRLLRFPAYAIAGPILTSAVAHLTGVLTSAPPPWTVELTQLVIGISLGVRFTGMRFSTFTRAIGLSLLYVVASLIIAVIAGLLLHEVVGERVEAVVLAFAPGGLAEMSLVAVSLNISVLYVSAHHVARIVLSITEAKVFAHRVADTKPGGT